MCGILGLLLADEDSHVNQMLFDGLTVLQHRGQDAAGIVTSERGRLHLRKDNGLVKDVFQTNHMMDLRGSVGLGHVRYPTAGDVKSFLEEMAAEGGSHVSLWDVLKAHRRVPVLVWRGVR